MNISEWLDKYRFKIGIVLIIIIIIGIVFLFWGDKIIGNKNNDDQEKYTSSLESRISELENKISNMDQDGQIAGASQDETSEDTEEQKQEQENQSAKININTADASELDQLPGVGPTRAQYIIEYRESHGGFKTTSEIQNIKGIGPKTYEKMRGMITVE